MELKEYRDWFSNEFIPRYNQITSLRALNEEEQLTKLTTDKLEEVLHGREVDWYSSDQKDTKTLFENIAKLVNNHPGWYARIFEPFADAPSGGSDDYVAYMYSEKLTDDEEVIVHDLIWNLSAEVKVKYKTVTREFEISVELPVDVDPEDDLEIVIDEVTVSYCYNGKRVKPPEDSISIKCLSDP